MGNLWDGIMQDTLVADKNWYDASIIWNLYKELFFPDERVRSNSIHAQSRVPDSIVWPRARLDIK